MRTLILTRLLVLLPAVTGCGAAEGTDVDEPGLTEDEGIERAGLRKGAPGARVGDGNYCDDPAHPCLVGEGDCDSSAGCNVGLVCGRGKLVQFGFSGGDGCVPAHCVNKRRDADETQIDCGGSCGSICAAPACRPNGSNGRCSDDCPCGLGEGDCDSNQECVAGLVCVGKLSQFGFSAGNACVPSHCANHRRDGDETQVDCGGSCGTTCAAPACPANGSGSHCSTECLCGLGEGDCDSNAECKAGLSCVGRLSQFGFPTGNACVPSHCANHRLDGDETRVDCGGSCGSVGCETPCLVDGIYVIPLTGQFRDYEPPFGTHWCPSDYTPYTSTVTVTVANGSVQVSGDNYSSYMPGGLSGIYPVTQVSNDAYTAEIRVSYGVNYWQEFQCGLADMFGTFGIMDSAEGYAKFTLDCKAGTATFDADCFADKSTDGCYPNYEDISHGSLVTR